MNDYKPSIRNVKENVCQWVNEEKFIKLRLNTSHGILPLLMIIYDSSGNNAGFSSGDVWYMGG